MSCPSNRILPEEIGSETDGGAQQRGLPGAVVAHYGGDSVGGNGDRDTVDDFGAAVTGSHVDEFEHHASWKVSVPSEPTAAAVPR